MVQIRVAAEFLCFADCVDAPVRDAGHKARTLARLVCAGLPVPPGFVVRCNESADQASLQRAAEKLGAVLIVRSSATSEDSADSRAPGLFLSVRDVRPIELARAVADVRASLAQDDLRGYWGLCPQYRPHHARATMAVIVQRQVDGARGTIYTRTTANSVFIAARDEAGDHFVASVDRETGEVQADKGFPARAEKLMELAMRCEDALQDESLDIEWALEQGQGRLWIVQARHLAHANVKPLVSMKLFEFTATDDRVWRWDAEHNPRPLSCAQTGLVERIDAADIAPYRMRVVAGHLYCTVTASATASASASATATATATATASATAMLDATLEPVASLADAVAAYEAFYRIYVDLSGSGTQPVEPLDRSQLSTMLTHVAPEWDVACAPYGEHAAPIDDRIVRYLSSWAERDDLYYGRAQQLVRNSLLELAGALGLASRDDIFWLPLSDLLEWEANADSSPDPAALAALAAQQRSTIKAQSRWRMPLAVKRGGIVNEIEQGSDLWRGHGIGARVIATVAHADAASSVPPGHALVAPTVTPQMVVQARNAACIVSDHGSALGHAVAMASELGIPCVVGCHGASAQLRTGDSILVDGANGLVVRLTR